MSDKIFSEVLAGAPFLKTAVLKFLELLPKRALEMEKALAEADYELVASIAHRLKGAGGTHGYSVVTEAARTIETVARGKDEARTTAVLLEFRELLDRLVAEPPPG